MTKFWRLARAQERRPKTSQPQARRCIPLNSNLGLTRRRLLAIACICIPATALKAFHNLLRSQQLWRLVGWRPSLEFGKSSYWQVVNWSHPSEMDLASASHYFAKKIQALDPSACVPTPAFR